ncbi:MAG TPA: hypothetical protein VN698_06040, partial [Bacteroidia bacterium]|nr:hypothetical protein [Bacteroidia bacterium]
NLLSFFIFIDFNHAFIISLDLFFSLGEIFKILHPFEFLVIFFIDLILSVKFFLLETLNPKNFSGILYYFAQFLEFVFFEMIRQFEEQGDEYQSDYFSYWGPRYLLGDSLSRSIQFNKLVDVFNFSGIVREKIFVYRRVGIVHSRFWLFHMYPTEHTRDNIELLQIGKLVEPDRWLLDFRNFNLLDYFDPWFQFHEGSVFRPSFPQQKVTVELLHNYHSIMEAPYFFPKERVYSDEYVSTFFLFELLLMYFLISSFVLIFDRYVQSDGLTRDEIEPVLEDMDLYDSRYYQDWNTPENFESQMFSMYPYDFLDYFTDDDLSWDSLLAQPYSLRDSFPQSLDTFEITKQQNYLLDEFKSFSFLLPLLRLFYNLSIYKPLDYFLFKDSGKAFKLIVYLFSYIPIGVFIVFLKVIIYFFELILSLPLLLRIVILFLLFCFAFLFLFYLL